MNRLPEPGLLRGDPQRPRRIMAAARLPEKGKTRVSRRKNRGAFFPERNPRTLMRKKNPALAW